MDAVDGVEKGREGGDVDRWMDGVLTSIVRRGGGSPRRRLQGRPSEPSYSMLSCSGSSPGCCYSTS